MFTQSCNLLDDINEYNTIQNKNNYIFNVMHSHR